MADPAVERPIDTAARPPRPDSPRPDTTYQESKENPSAGPAINRTVSSDDERAAERDLVERVRAGDPAAAERMVRDATPRMLAVARRFFTDESDAHDAVQDAFLSAFRALDRFEGDARLSTWLHRVTVNACLMKLRTRRRRPEVSIDALQPRFADDGHPIEFASPWNPNPSAGIEATETATLVRGMIDRLPEDARAVILLRDIEGFDTALTAEMLGITEASVKTRLHRARLALRTLLDPHMHGRPHATAGTEAAQ
jgi:RNA polymerase sigma-70 factor (ECF subfamily)